jgi:phosphatidylglycerophosphatase C
MKQQKISIYDFDSTLYNGDCLVDFYKFCLKKYPYKIFKLPLHTLLYILWKSKIISDKFFKERFLSVVNWKNRKRDVKEFWIQHETKIFSFVLHEFKKDKSKGLRVIIASASPKFLLLYITEKLGADILIATDFNNYKIIGENCKGCIKVDKLREFEKQKNVKFYILKMTSDSLDDLPLYKLAEECYKVDKYGKISKGIPKE